MKSMKKLKKIKKDLNLLNRTENKKYARDKLYFKDNET
jgi:hypothetical protein